jgi:hypothetical protein
LECSKGDGGRNHLIEAKFRRDNTESFGHESLRSVFGGQNSLWRTREVHARSAQAKGESLSHETEQKY